MLKYVVFNFGGDVQPYHYAAVKDGVLRTACGSAIPRTRGIELKRDGVLGLQDEPYKHDVCKACARCAGAWIKKTLGAKPKNWVSPPNVEKANTEVDHEYFDEQADDTFQLESPIYRSAKLSAPVPAKPATVQRGNTLSRSYSPG